jgi:hypothetical protein
MPATPMAAPTVATTMKAPAVEPAMEASHAKPAMIEERAVKVAVVKVTLSRRRRRAAGRAAEG